MSCQHKPSVISPVKIYCAAIVCGTFKTYKYHLNPEKSYDIPDPVSSMNEKLKEFSRQEFYNLLVKSIDAGINSQKEKADYDSD